MGKSERFTAAESTLWSWINCSKTEKEIRARQSRVEPMEL